MKAAELVYATPVLPEHLKPGFDKIRVMGRAECVQFWNTLTDKTLEIIHQKSQLIFHFHKEGWDIAALGNGHSYWYLEMAYGRMLEGLFLALSATDPGLLDHAGKLTIPDQVRVVANERVPVLLSFKDDGKPYFQDMQLQSLAPRLAKQVMRRGKIQTEEEQIAYLRMKAKTKAPMRVGRLVPDVKRKGAVYTFSNVATFFPEADIEAVLNAIRAAG